MRFISLFSVGYCGFDCVVCFKDALWGEAFWRVVILGWWIVGLDGGLIVCVVIPGVFWVLSCVLWLTFGFFVWWSLGLRLLVTSCGLSDMDSWCGCTAGCDFGDCGRLRSC